MMVQTGIDRLIQANFAPLKGSTVGLVCNQASVAGDLRHALQHFQEADARGRLRLAAVAGPQHGLWGHTQDNMIEWQSYQDQQSGLPVFSLYGEHRKPGPEMLEGLDALVIDLQDVGAKYYTFIWTMAFCMEACQEAGIKVFILDRPNPISGTLVEGPSRNDDFRSFVGLYPLTIRHGMSIGEVATYLEQRYYRGCDMEVIKLHDWRRDHYFEETGLPWAMPSPNMPAIDTAVVYPGMCLLEATNLSEGRGTTRPFETFGATFIDGFLLAAKLNDLDLPGIYFRPIEFQPTFHKFAGEVCGGCFMHVVDRASFRPFLTTIAILREVRALYGKELCWKAPPYEYEFEKMPFDILVGNDWLRDGIDKQSSLAALENRWQAEAAEFEPLRQAALLYK